MRRDAGRDFVLLPGLIDTHVHAPQSAQRAIASIYRSNGGCSGSTLPLEARYADERFARGVQLARAGVAVAGSTHAVYSGSIHGRPHSRWRRRVEHRAACLRRPGGDGPPEGTPDYYRDDGAAQGVAAPTVDRGDPGPRCGTLVQPIVTPRFIPACTDALLEGLGGSP